MNKVQLGWRNLTPKFGNGDGYGRVLKYQLLNTDRTNSIKGSGIKRTCHFMENQYLVRLLRPTQNKINMPVSKLD